jgi:hypothetical protein
MWLSWAMWYLYSSEAKYEGCRCIEYPVVGSCWCTVVIYQDGSSPVKCYRFSICCSREATLLDWCICKLHLILVTGTWVHNCYFVLLLMHSVEIWSGLKPGNTKCGFVLGWMGALNFTENLCIIWMIQQLWLDLVSCLFISVIGCRRCSKNCRRCVCCHDNQNCRCCVCCSDNQTKTESAGSV